MKFQFEQLESRLLLAASIRQRGKNLIIVGDNADDSVRIVGTGTQGSVQVDLNGDGDLADAGEDRVFTGVKNITFRGKAGNDSLVVEGVDIAGNLRFVGARGNDSGTIINSHIGGRLVVNGGQGQDAWEDLGGNTFNKAPKINVESPTTEPLNPVVLVNDSFEVNDNDPISLLNQSLFANDSQYVRDNGQVTSIFSATAVDDSFNVNGELGLDLTHGTLTVRQDGTFSYIPKDDLVDGTSAVDTFSYVVTDVQGNTATASVTISVRGDIDDVVTLTENGVAFTLGGTTELLVNDGINPGSINGLLFPTPGGDVLGFVAVPQLPAGGPITVRATAAAAANIPGVALGDEIGVLTVDATTGAVTFTFAAGMEAAFTNALGTGDTGTLLEFQYQLTAGAGATTGTVTLTVTGENDAPSDPDGEDTFMVQVDGSIAGANLIGDDVDPDDDDVTITGFTYTDVNGDAAVGVFGQEVTLESGATLTVYSTGTFDYDPNGAFPNGGTDTFSYNTSDGVDVSDEVAVNIVINAAPSDPEGEDTFTIGINGLIEGESLIGDDVDPNGDTLSIDGFTYVDQNGDTVEGQFGQQVILQSGANLTVYADGTFDYDPNGAFPTGGTETFQYTLSDGFNAPVAVTATITINAPPLDASGGDLIFGSTVNPLVLQNLFLDDSDPENDSLSIARFTYTDVNGDIVEGELGQEVTLESGGLLTVFANGFFTFLPNGAYPPTGATVTFSYFLTDGINDPVEVPVTLQLFGPPEI